MISAPRLHPSTVLQGRYRLDHELGHGGMSMVWFAQDLKHSRRVVLKILRPQIALTVGSEQFQREIEFTARLDHPNILPLLDSGVASGAEMAGPSLLYYVMPYVEGESLRARVEREKLLPLSDALEIAREVAEALSFAHGQGVVHRDIKPENILLEGGHAVVADFGIAKAITAATSANDSSAGMAVGTPYYMSPEQAAGRRHVDGRSDIYALGCVLYEMLAGQPPYSGATRESVSRQHFAAPVPDIGVVRPEVPGTVAGAIERAMAKLPADRYQTATQFAAALGPDAHPTRFIDEGDSRLRDRALHWATKMLGGDRRR